MLEYYSRPRAFKSFLASTTVLNLLISFGLIHLYSECSLLSFILFDLTEIKNGITIHLPHLSFASKIFPDFTIFLLNWFLL